ncbi:cytochrome P450, partial [Endogone sp. FLAS-F59071]
MSQQILDFLTTSKDNITSLGTEYIPHVLTNISTGQVVGYITAAMVLALSYRIYNMTMVPQKLRHLPHVPFSKTFPTIINPVPVDIYENDLYITHYKEHGLVVEMQEGIWRVSIANPEYAKKLLMRLETFQKKGIFFGPTDSRLMARFLGSNNILFQNGLDWKRHRKIANPAFHRAMPVKLFGDLTQVLFKRLEAEGNRIDVHDYMQRFTLDVIGMAGFGFNFNVSYNTISHSMEDAKNQWVTIYNEIIKGGAVISFAVFPWVERYFLWALPKRRELHKKLDKLNGLLSEIIENKKRIIRQEGYETSGDDDTEKDLLTMMIEANETEKLGGLSDQELK